MADGEGGPEIVGAVLKMRGLWRLLRALAVATGVWAGIALWLLVGVDHPLRLVASAAVLSTGLGIAFYRLGAKYTLEVTHEGMVHRLKQWKRHEGGPGYRLVVPWDQIASIGPCRVGHYFTGQVLAASAGATFEGPDGGPIEAPARSGLRRQEADRRIILTYYNRDWTDGPVGAALRANRPDLMP